MREAPLLKRIAASHLHPVAFNYVGATLPGTMPDSSRFIAGPKECAGARYSHPK